VAALRGVSLSLAGRVEGVPATDILGKTIGFRRPGFFVSIEPGVIYSTDRATFFLSFPLRVHQFVQDSLGAPRDSTFADHLLLASVSYRFGGP
jgi:hypothetical protein